ncbi:RNA metabolism protein [Lithospermum erythrorhizon]|uniref:Polyadenylate-binding protein n=1 Tax=Lithospermum erythrorhizon TaxID=34254 RepID=A0AAV3R1T0_LITER
MADVAQIESGGGSGVVTSLYVGDLEVNVTDGQLFDLFNQLIPVVSVRVCRDLATRRSLGYGYVNYTNPQDAARALELLNFTTLNDKPIRVMYSNRDPTTRKTGSANIFIKNLDKAIDHKALHETFSTFGNILSCKLAVDALGHSKGYGFVQYHTEESAQKAIQQLNGMLLNDKQVFVGPFLRRQDRELSNDKTKFTNVFVKNLSDSVTEDDLQKAFGEFGKLTSIVVMRDEDGKSKCFGFVNFDSPDDAARSVDSLNGYKFDDKPWYVCRAQKKSERERDLKIQFEQTVKEAAEKSQGLNLYIKNIDDSLDDDKLKEMFSSFGTITSCKVMRDPVGVSKGSGFVAFSTPEEASKALMEMNGKMVIGKPLYVAFAQRKEDRRARLQAQFSQLRPIAVAPSVAPRMPMYAPTGPGMGQQIFYGQHPPAIIPPQPGFGYPQQLVSGARPGAPPMPNFFMPMLPQGPPGPRPGARRPQASFQQGQLPVPPIHQQMAPRGRGNRYLRGGPEVNASNGPTGMSANNLAALASVLANSTPAQQRMMLGECLYPLVEQLEPDTAAKVTGMLLEMDQTEVLHLLESPDALKSKVGEAMDVLRNVTQQGNNAADQFSSLSIDDDIVP